MCNYYEALLYLQMQLLFQHKQILGLLFFNVTTYHKWEYPYEHGWYLFSVWEANNSCCRTTDIMRVHHNLDVEEASCCRRQLPPFGSQGWALQKKTQVEESVSAGWTQWRRGRALSSRRISVTACEGYTVTDICQTAKQNWCVQYCFAKVSLQTRSLPMFGPLEVWASNSKNILEDISTIPPWFNTGVYSNRFLSCGLENKFHGHHSSRASKCCYGWLRLRIDLWGAAVGRHDSSFIVWTMQNLKSHLSPILGRQLHSRGMLWPRACGQVHGLNQLVERIAGEGCSRWVLWWEEGPIYPMFSGFYSAVED